MSYATKLKRKSPEEYHKGAIAELERQLLTVRSPLKSARLARKIKEHGQALADIKAKSNAETGTFEIGGAK